ncbi:tRNA pseudouridine synthase 10 [Halarchaeum rubridurum]|uniref:tRNA pseudouridine synthase Pus10 n=1 Tax=Halarchaeum rubridurum TaxID=489911 RepID=A0A830FXZ5_9EURY|nr:tRNA pseudouridine(54/55) synthase Pus10 [Halarchaeum rubridurum]MBP1954061.1 tRNA pseudouridine synthase 10 [Halarchaeum rubridurum]GGM57022.1 tRNA pseudouridine(54/55) synthase Pus10 [Halarchaeum rubridurum]
MSLLEDARAVVENGPVCDACLGRQFADRSFGLTNAERGAALRVSVELDADDPHEDVAPADCWVCEGLCATFDEWAERAVAALDDVEFATYQVGTRAPPLVEENEALLRESAGIAEGGEPFKSEFNREVGKRVGERTGTDVDFERPDVLFVLDVDDESVDAQVNPAFVYGRYRKLSREIPQTEWPCRECNGTGRRGGEPCIHCDGTGYMYEESVEQLVSPPILEAMEGDDSSFHGAGREDIDAKMLGTGRPFVVEVKHPRTRFPDVTALEAEINDGTGKVEVEGLRLATYDMVERVKELDASKTYRARVRFDEPVTADDFAEALDELDGATIEQDTPERVSHRRAAKTRVREAYAVSGELADETHATVEIHGEGGLYIKELVSSDEGRTTPSLAGLLGTPCHVTELDVLAVEGEDEPFEDPDFFLDTGA